MMDTNTIFKAVAKVGNQQFSMDADFPLLREMLEGDSIVLEGRKIAVMSIEVSIDHNIVYFYGDIAE